jgi:membrane-anchored protein YejM (alkaline phosphatase superfamily)
MIFVKDKRYLRAVAVCLAFAGLTVMAWSRYLVFRIMYSLKGIADLFGYLLPRNCIKVAFTQILLFAGLGLIYLAVLVYTGKVLNPDNNDSRE